MYKTWSYVEKEAIWLRFSNDALDFAKHILTNLSVTLLFFPTAGVLDRTVSFLNSLFLSDCSYFIENM